MRAGGQDEVIEEFCRRLQGRLVGSLTLYSGDVGLAQEVTQEALARAWQRWTRVSALQDPDAWVFTVAFNLANSSFRRRAAETKALRKMRDAPQRDSPDIADAFAVRAAVAKLPPRQRKAVVLRFFADLTVEATAVVMGCRPGTVQALTHQAVSHLRSTLDDRPGLNREELVRDV